jgi:HEAT repeat protein
MADSRWYVVRNMVLLVGASRDPSAAMSLLPALHHSDERVRREAVRSLAEIGDPRCAAVVRRALQDPDSPVRVLAVRAVARLNDRGATDELLRLVTAPGFAGRDQAEIAAFFDTIGRIADDAAVPALERLWADRLLRAQPLPLLLGAIRSLACMRSQASIDSLERARHSRNREVREAAEKALSRPGDLPSAPAALAAR